MAARVTVLAVMLGGAVGAAAGCAAVDAGEGGDRGSTGQVSNRSAGSPPDRPFAADSWWNTPLPTDAPLDPLGSQTLDYLRTGPESGQGCVVLAGAGDSPWGQPIYTSRRSDPAYRLHIEADLQLPELRDLRIPHGAESASNNDGSMTVYDPRKRFVVMLTEAHFDQSHHSWSASGATVTYLDSNGLHARTGQSDEPRNLGSHRGNNGATAAVSFDEVKRGAIEHVLKVAAGPEVADRFVFPMVGSDGDYTGDDPAVPPEGLRFRLKPSLDLEGMDLEPEALVIARALQRYGFYIGDSGGTTALKLEDTVSEGRGQLWDLTADALCGMPLTAEYWDVIEPGFDPATGDHPEGAS